MEFAVGGVFLQQIVQNLAGLQAEVGEESRLLPLHAVGTLAARENGRVESEMAQEVERVGARLPRPCGDCLEVNPALSKLLGEVAALAGVGPEVCLQRVVG